MKGVKSLLFEFSTLQKATENFSDLNKLGEGGFGPVYKVLIYLFSNCFQIPTLLLIVGLELPFCHL